MDEPIDEILDANVLGALNSAQQASIQLIRYERDTGTEIVSQEIGLPSEQLSILRELFLDTNTYWLGLRRCAPLSTVRIRFSPTDLVATLDFRCNHVIFVFGAIRSGAFFDHRRDDLMLLANLHFPIETSLDSATLVKKEFITAPHKQRRNGQIRRCTRRPRTAHG